METTTVESSFDSRAVAVLAWLIAVIWVSFAMGRHETLVYYRWVFVFGAVAFLAVLWRRPQVLIYGCIAAVLAVSFF